MRPGYLPTVGREDWGCGWVESNHCTQQCLLELGVDLVGILEVPSPLQPSQHTHRYVWEIRHTKDGQNWDLGQVG